MTRAKLLKNSVLVSELVLAAYDAGYYSGSGQDGQPGHKEAIDRRETLWREVLHRLEKLDGRCGQV